MPAKSTPFLIWFQEMETGNKHQDQQNQGKKPSKEPLKVKYISSPVLVNAKNPTEFKAIVQELTGKDSSEGHHQRSPGDAGGRATSVGYSQLPTEHGEKYAKLGCEVDQIQGSSTMAGHEFDADLFWKLSESLSKSEFPFR